ncbi:hypothetical protein JQ582_17305 [Bradyrhizobium japonicum]|jgi:hypothetical protein|uniref:Uncharacterized protein n=1 Tax=Bradyrhizobium japonicum TaxID=375 RepID=A0ABV2RM09_BRAJP|nr:hypothetical protein [Bradyrhizobium japonicum]MBR0745690.1 hypothetical protein [Bradyrhizobium japonicum]MBR0763313.1 hypothetical protein [Bradyrhizobium japonicum]MCP1762574.1 hypothetical protein [Bradyrhizobium japonicum]MCP1794152.1 hypothetical protein [Bradyrhizobium japonicum]MCP1806588.1 hypothetical protein [Bradyrhizobium japonicum]
MRRLIVSGLIAVTSFAVAATMLHSNTWPTNTWPTTGTVGAARTPVAQESRSGVLASKLPVQDFDDRSLVFPRETKPQ